jgi:hypothetical protein
VPLAPLQRYSVEAKGAPGVLPRPVPRASPEDRVRATA